MAPCQGRDSAFPAGAGRVSIGCLVVMSLALDEQRGAGQHHKADQQDVGQILGGHAGVDAAGLGVGESSSMFGALMVPLSPALVVV